MSVVRVFVIVSRTLCSLMLLGSAAYLASAGHSAWMWGVFLIAGCAVSVDVTLNYRPDD